MLLTLLIFLFSPNLATSSQDVGSDVLPQYADLDTATKSGTLGFLESAFTTGIDCMGALFGTYEGRYASLNLEFGQRIGRVYPSYLSLQFFSFFSQKKIIRDVICMLYGREFCPYLKI